MKMEEEKKDEEVVIPDIESYDQIKPQLPNENEQLIQQLEEEIEYLSTKQLYHADRIKELQ